MVPDVASTLWGRAGDLLFLSLFAVVLVFSLVYWCVLERRAVITRSLRRWARLEGCRLIRWQEPGLTSHADALWLRSLVVTVVDHRREVRKARIGCDGDGGIWSFQWISPGRTEGVWRAFAPAEPDATTQGQLLGRKRTLDPSTWISRRADGGEQQAKRKPISPTVDPLERLLERKRSLHLSESVASAPPAGLPLLCDDWLDR